MLKIFVEADGRNFFNAEISYKRARGSVILEARLLAAWKSTKELATSEATVNIKYRPRFMHLSTKVFSTALFARSIACVGRHIDKIPRDPEDHPAGRIDIANEG